jgi:putative flippase GtrA
MQTRDMFKKFRRFLAVGATATGVHYCALIGGVEVLHINPTMSSSAGFTIGAIANYLLNHRYTFESSAPHLRAASRFLVIAILGLGLNAALMWLFTQRAAWQYLVAQVIATGCVLLWNFWGNAFWSFATPAVAQSRLQGTP